MKEVTLLCSRTTRWYERFWFYVQGKNIGDMLYLGNARQIIARENEKEYSCSFWTLPGTNYVHCVIKEEEANK